MQCGQGFFRLKSSDRKYEPEEGARVSQCRPDEPDILAARPMTTLLNADTADFDSYAVQGEVLVTFALKEFKALISFADAVNSPVDAGFSEGGQCVGAGRSS